MNDMLERLEIAKELIELDIEINIEGFSPEADAEYIRSRFQRLKELHQIISEKYDGNLNQSFGLSSSDTNATYTVQMDFSIEARSHQKPATTG